MTHTHRGVFITGTDTGVGKTVVTAGLARALKARGLDIGVMKPVQTGCWVRQGRLVSPDAAVLQRAAGCDDPPELVTPYRLRAPLAPMVAASFERRRIRFEPILAAYRRLASRHEIVLVEGVGGLLVPLTTGLSVADLIRQLDLPALIVARAGLGTLNHILLTAQAARAKKIQILGVILNTTGPGRPGPAERTNAGALRRLITVPLLGSLPYLPGNADRVTQRIAELVEGWDWSGLD